MTFGKILFHNNQISERGESTNLVANASFLKSIYGLESVFSAPETDLNNTSHIRELEQAGFEIFLYKSPNELHSYSKSQSISHAIWMNDGRYSNLWIPNAKNLIHAVFNNYEPYGDRYAYVSKWLHDVAIKAKRGRLPTEVEDFRAVSGSPYTIDRSLNPGWVPHTVVTKQGDGETFRKKLRIPKDSKVIGRIGGLTEFNDPLAKQCIIDMLKRSDHFFVFVNTFPFVIHKRVRYLGYISSEEKWDFYAGCDVFLNARLMGESFGYTIAEPLMLGKPVIGPHKIRNKEMDCHHIEILKSQNLLYKSARHLELLIKNQLESPMPSYIARSLVSDFSEDVVAKRFYEFFLKETK